MSEYTMDYTTLRELANYHYDKYTEFRERADEAYVPVEPPAPSVVSFQRKLANGKLLDYVAIRPHSQGSCWYVTGGDMPNVLTWNELTNVAHGRIMLMRNTRELA